MATIVDSLLVELGLDASKFTKGQKEAATSLVKMKDEALRHSKEIEGSNRAVAETFSKVRNEVLALFAALLGARGVKEFISNINEANAAVGRFAGNIGESPQTVAAWGMAVERMGGSAQDAAGSINAMAKALFDLHTNGKALPESLYRLSGLTHTKIDTEHGVTKFMNDIATSAQILARTDMAQAHFLLTGAGIDDATANTMIKYGAGMSAYVDSLSRGLAPTNQAIKAAQDLNEQFARAQQEVTSLGNVIATQLDPELSKMLDQFSRWIEDNKQLLGADIVTWAHQFADGLQEVEAHLKPVVDLLNQMHQKKLEADKSIEAHPRSWWERLFPGFSSLSGGLPGEGPGALGGAHAAEVNGQPVSRGNPVPVELVKNSVSAAGSLLGGPIGTGGPLPTAYQGGAGAPRGFRARGRFGGGAGVLGGGSAGVSSGSFMDALAEIESSNSNIYSKVDPDPEGPGTRSQGYFQINTPTWREFARSAGVDIAQYPNAMSAPRDVQAKVASVIPLSRFGPRTRRMLQDRFGPLDLGKTVGEDAARFSPQVIHPKIIAGRPHVIDAKTGQEIDLPPSRKDIDSGKYDYHGNGPNVPPAWWNGRPLSQNGAPTGGAVLSTLAGNHSVTTSQTSNAIHVGGINVDARGGDSREIADNVSSSLERSMMTLLAQSGQA